MSSSLFPHFVPIVNGAAPGGNADILPTDFLGGAGAEKGLREAILQITPTAATVVNLIERPTERDGSVKATAQIQAIPGEDLVDGDDFTLRNDKNTTKNFEVEKTIAATGEIQAIEGADLVDGETFTLDDGVNPAVEFEFERTVKATGSIQAVAKASLLDEETFTIDDGVNPAVVFEFDDDAALANVGAEAIDLTGLVTAEDVAEAIVDAINGAADLDVTASLDPEDATLVLLENDLPGTVGNEAILETVVAAGFVVVGMTGGVGTDGVSGDETVQVAVDATAEEVAEAIAAAINDDATIDIVASINAEDPTIVDLVNELAGTVGNTSSAETVTEAGFTVSDMAGGVGVDGVAGGAVALTIPDDWTAAEVAEYLVEKINEAAQRYVASVNADDPTKVDLVQQIAGTDGNRTNAEAVADAGFTVSNFAGGTGVIATHKLNGGAQVAALCRYSERMLINAAKDYNVQIVTDGVVIGLAVASTR